MKTLVTLAIVMAGMTANAMSLTCQTPFGKSVGFSITSAGIASNGQYVKANGESATSLYFRSVNTLVIVNKSILDGQFGRITWETQTPHEPVQRAVYLCNK